MSFDERNSDIPSHPPKFEDLNSRLLTFQWVSRQLGYLERAKDCKVKNALRSELTKLLDDIQDTENENLIKRLTTDLNDRTSELVRERANHAQMRDTASKLGSQISDNYLVSRKGLKLFLWVFAFVIIAIWIISRNTMFQLFTR